MKQYLRLLLSARWLFVLPILLLIIAWEYLWTGKVTCEASGETEESEGRQDMRKPSTFGPDYVAEHDAVRVSTQLEDIRAHMIFTRSHRTLAEIASATGHPAASVSAQLRHLRKPRFGSHTVHKRRRGDPSDGLWEYRVFALDETLPDYASPPKTGQGMLLDNSAKHHGE